MKLLPSPITVRDLVLQLIQWSPELQEKYASTGNAEWALIAAHSPYQALMAKNLLISWFSSLPLHPDLKVFEGIKFEPRAESKIAALTFAYSMTVNVLYNSFIYEPVLGAILDEAALFAEKTPEEFKKFSKLSDFDKGTERSKDIFSLFLKRGNLSGWVHLVKACSALVYGIYYPFSSHLLDENDLANLTTISKYLTQYPKRIGFF